MLRVLGGLGRCERAHQVSSQSTSQHSRGMPERSSAARALGCGLGWAGSWCPPGGRGRGGPWGSAREGLLLPEMFCEGYELSVLRTLGCPLSRGP